MATTIIVVGDDSVKVQEEVAKSRSSSAPSAPKKRRKTRYQAVYGRNFKDLKKKHPRWSFKTLATKAHAMTRRSLGRKK
ncbi:MAG: hypothetical protein QGH83_15605 [Candidatus Pacebacteria bacterium]|jgi:hypothetical protein|nr:hypothetical protein [Candidatus Paceibacterota bacterium]|tara:strand:+ start:438 stop:674 length:237 start_codon:yes stop_codon:yes gene_type:complete